ncbi:MAG: class I SAM-dependent methyltransferase [Nocardioidaceae bacterium]
MTDRPFSAWPGVDSWVTGLANLRNIVRQELVRTQLAEVIAGRSRLRVLDVGCGQGTQALHLARAGHHVTGLDTSADLLRSLTRALSGEESPVRERVHLVQGPAEQAPRLAPGPFDLVLCHGVLMYLDDPQPLLEAVSDVASSHATVSLLVRNGLAPAMRDGLRGRWDEALRAFDDLTYVNRLGLPAHAHHPAALDHSLGGWGFRQEAWYGVRVFTDHRPEEPPAEDEDPTGLLRAESEAGRRDPYRSVAALLHLVYRRG